MCRMRCFKIKDCCSRDWLINMTGTTTKSNAIKKDRFALYKKMGISHYGFFTFKISGCIENDINVVYRVRPCLHIVLCSAFFFALLIYACIGFILGKVNLYFVLMAFVINAILDLSVVIQAHACNRWFQKRFAYSDISR